MKNPKKLWKDISCRFAEQSRCKSRKVGAILVKDDFLIGEGWNSPPKGSSADSCPRAKCQKGSCAQPGEDLDQAICAHAEANLIGHCAGKGKATEGATLYTTTKPCAECAKLICAALIGKVIYFEDYPSPLTDKILENAGIGLFNKSYM